MNKFPQLWKDEEWLYVLEDAWTRIAKQCWDDSWDDSMEDDDCSNCRYNLANFYDEDEVREGESRDECIGGIIGEALRREKNRLGIKPGETNMRC